MDIPDKVKGHAAVLCTVLCGSVNMPVTKYILSTEQIGATALSQWRVTMACVVFWIVSLFMPGGISEKVEKKDMFVIFLCALFGMSMNQMMFMVGFYETSTIDAGIIGSMIPVFTMILAAVILREPITSRKVSGVVLGLIGGLIILFSGTAGSVGSSTLWGTSMHTGAAVFYSTYLIINRKVASKYSPMTISRWMFFFAIFIVAPFGLMDLINAPVWSSSDVPMEVYAGMVYVVIGSTVLAYLFVPVSLRYIRPTTVSMYNYLQPLIVSVIAVYIGQDVFSVYKPVAGILIFIGVYLVTTSRSRKDIELSLTQKDTQCVTNDR